MSKCIIDFILKIITAYLLQLVQASLEVSYVTSRVILLITKTFVFLDDYIL